MPFIRRIDKHPLNVGFSTIDDDDYLPPKFGSQFQDDSETDDIYDDVPSYADALTEDLLREETFASKQQRRRAMLDNAMRGHDDAKQRAKHGTSKDGPYL